MKKRHVQRGFIYASRVHGPGKRIPKRIAFLGKSHLPVLSSMYHMISRRANSNLHLRQRERPYPIHELLR